MPVSDKHQQMCCASYPTRYNLFKNIINLMGEQAVSTWIGTAATCQHILLHGDSIHAAFMYTIYMHTLPHWIFVVQIENIKIRHLRGLSKDGSKAVNITICS